MFQDSEVKSPVAVRVERTEGDFPHVRRPNVWLACCTTTTCCLILLLGAGGGLIGLITGIVLGSRSSHSDTDSKTAAVAIRFGKIVFMAFGIGVMGVLIGAAIGFVLDNVLGTY